MRTTTDIVTALIAALQALTWTPTGGSPEPAFGRVARFDSTDLEAAFAELLLSEQRVALVIYLGDRYEPDIRGTVAVRRVVDLAVLVSDRRIGKRQEAVYGTATNPGVLGLKDLVYPAVTGRLIPNPDGVDLEPTSAELIELQDRQTKTRNQPGRAVAVIEIVARGGGSVIAPRQLGPVR